MESFEVYLKKNIVKKSFRDVQRAKKLIKDGKDRIAGVGLLDIEKLPKFVFENIYDAIRDFLFAILLNEGYKTNSHEASISYLLNKGFDVYAVNKLDKFRYRRNGSKYYGEVISVEEAKDILSFYSSIKNKFDGLLKQLD